jgi:hypothetical protein
VVEEPKAAVGEPGLSFVRKPEPNCYSQLEEKRRVQNLADLKALEHNFEKVQNAEQRLNAREMCHLRMQQKDGTTRTRTEIQQRRRKEMVEENTQKFGSQTIGIHG